jgi:TRAP-type C4-dicarboxylate transport system substrate-binding protein
MQMTTPPLQRRTLLKAGAAAALGVPTLSVPAQTRITLKFHTFMSPTSYVWLNMHKPWMDKVERESGGRLRFEGYPAMQLGGSPAQLFDQAKDGIADIVWTLPGNTPGRFPRTEAFELPFIMSNAEATSKALWAYIQTQAADEYREVRPLAFQVHGPGLFHIKNRVIESPDDLRGLKVRGPTRQATKMLGYLGATPVGMPLPQIPDALSKGVIDGCVLPWEVVPSIRAHELTGFHSEFDPAGGALYTNTFVMAMNLRRYNTLPDDLRRVIDNNSGPATSGWLGKTQQAGDAPARRMAAERGNRIHTIGLAESQEFRRRSRQVEVEWVQDMDRRGFKGRELLDTARQLIQKHTQG